MGKIAHLFFFNPTITGYALPPDKPKLEMTSECARPDNRPAQVWQE